MHVRREIGHEIDADDAALVGDRLDHGIRDIARVVVERAGAGMADRQRPFREGDRFLNGPGAAMGEVEQEPFGLNAADSVFAEIGEASVPRLDRTVAA